MGDLSPHFSVWEFRCPCGTCSGVPADPNVLGNTARWLETVRSALGGHPLRITSGFRCAAHNQEVGGATNSYHLRGWAADIVLRELSPATVQKILKARFPDLVSGLGLGKGYTHVDRRTHEPAMWRYGPDGKPRSVR